MIFTPTDTQGAVLVRFHGHPRLRVILIGAVIVLGIGLLAVGTTIRLKADNYLEQIDRLPDPFVSIPPSSRPSPGPGGMTFLLIGLDSKSNNDKARADTLMVARIPKERRNAYVISIPRDSWVSVPGHGMHKINASYALGGPALSVQTVEQLTHVRIDHVAVVGWDGFRAMTDAVGGVEITIPEDSYDPSQGVHFAKGTHRFDGERALRYVRQRYGLPRGDLDRMQRQQNYLRQLMSQVVEKKTITDPVKLDALLTAAAAAISVDSGLSNADLRWLAFDAPKLSEGVRFVSAPVERLAQVVDEAGVEQSVVHLSQAGNAALWQALGTDKMDEYAAQHAADVLGDTTR